MKFAMAAHNNAAIRSMLAPRFESIDVSGHSSGAAQMIAGLDALQPDPNKVSTTTVLNLSQVGDKITVEQRYDMTTKRTSEAGAVHKVELVTVSMDTWVNPVGVWLLERTVTNSLSIFRDGDLVVHKVKS